MAERNMSLKKCPMPSLEPNYRNKVFEEVATGYTYEMAIDEARRCLHVGINAGIAGPLLTTPGAIYADDRALAQESGYAVLPRSD